MTSVEIRSGSTLARVYPQIGFNLFSLIIDGYDYIRSERGFPPDGKPTHSGVPILFPWPNRIAGGRFTFEGREYLLPVNEQATGASIHGYAVDRPWRVIDSGPDFVTGEFVLSVDAPGCDWPADAGLRTTYRVDSATLICTSEVFSNDGRALPFGLGFHPYFKVPGPFDQWLLHVDAGKHWELTNMMPVADAVDVPAALDFRAPRRLGDQHLDDVLTGLPATTGVSARAQLRSLAATLTVASDEAFRDYVLFTPAARDSVAIEPYTCTTNAANLPAADSGWRVLEPGQRAVFEWRVFVE